MALPPAGAVLYWLQTHEIAFEKIHCNITYCTSNWAPSIVFSDIYSLPNTTSISLI